MKASEIRLNSASILLQILEDGRPLQQPSTAAGDKAKGKKEKGDLDHHSRSLDFLPDPAKITDQITIPETDLPLQ
jgi:hypothetical protein